MKRFVFLASLLVLTGCTSIPPHPDLRPELVKKLADKGVLDTNTRKIILVGSQGGFGSATQVIIKHDFLIQEIWDTIYQSRPYGSWAACGFRKILFYTDSQSATPTVELSVNVTDRCHFKGAFDEAFRCPGINKILDPMLKKEYEKKKNR